MNKFIRQMFFLMLILLIQLVTVSTTYGGSLASYIEERTVRSNQNTIERTFKKVAKRNIQIRIDAVAR